MAWLKERTWQLAVAIVLAVVAAWLMYVGGTDGVSPFLVWVGLALMIVAMAIPLASKVYLASQGEDEES